VCAFSAGTAQATLINTNPCNSETLSQPFAPWGDTNEYELVPGGSFGSSLAGWTISGGAGLISGGEPYGVTGSVSPSSLSLPAGSSVQTPFTCVDAGYPSLRFFARNDGLLSTMSVELVYRAPVLGLVPVPVGIVALSPQWKPTLPMVTLSVVPGLLTNGQTPVAIRFTELTGTSQIDDVFLDPRMRH
jgi:hypothetical protein